MRQDVLSEQSNALDIIGKKITDAEPLEVFEKAINNAKPLIEVRSKRVGGASYQVPMQVGPKRQQSLAFRWILASARGKKGKPMTEMAGTIRTWIKRNRKTGFGRRAKRGKRNRQSGR